MDSAHNLAAGSIYQGVSVGTIVEPFGSSCLHTTRKKPIPRHFPVFSLFSDRKINLVHPTLSELRRFGSYSPIIYSSTRCLSQPSLTLIRLGLRVRAIKTCISRCRPIF